MTVPQRRNEKKHRSRPKQVYRSRSDSIRLGINPYYSKDGSPMKLEDKPSFEEWLIDTEPVDTIEVTVNDPGRILKMAAQCDPDDDMGNDLEDIFEDY